MIPLSHLQPSSLEMDIAEYNPKRFYRNEVHVVEFVKIGRAAHLTTNRLVRRPE